MISHTLIYADGLAEAERIARGNKLHGPSRVWSFRPTHILAEDNPVTHQSDLIADAIAEHRRAHEAAEGDPATAYSRRITIAYTNWRGEFGKREIAPIRLVWGSTEWHPEPQWLIEAWDISKSAIRMFSLNDVGWPKAAQGDPAVCKESLPGAARDADPDMIRLAAKAMQESPAWAAVFGAGTAEVLARAALKAVREPSPVSSSEPTFGAGAGGEP